MNYHFQLSGIGPGLMALGLSNTAAGFEDFGYSYGRQAALDERNLDENVGLGLGTSVDWNCDGRLETGVSIDLQASNWCEVPGSDLAVLTDFDNWSAIRSYLQPQISVQQTSDAARFEPCISWQQYRPMAQKLARLRTQGLIPSATSRHTSATTAGQGDKLTRSFTIYNDGSETLNVSQMELDVPTTWISWEPAAPFDVAPGGSQQVMVQVDMTQAPQGETTRQLVIESNDVDESPFQDGVNLIIQTDGN
jgi:hypothetical protein